MNAKGMMHRIIGLTLITGFALSAEMAFAQVPGDGIPDIYFWTAGAGGVSIPTSAGNQFRVAGTLLLDTDGLNFIAVIISNNQELATPPECSMCPGDTWEGFPVLASESGDQSQWALLVLLDVGPSGLHDLAVSQDPANLQFLPEPAFNNLPAEYRTLGSIDIFHLDVTMVTGGPACGDGVVGAGEECDDGNTDDGDCCSSTCVFEPERAACGDTSDGVCDNPDTCDGAGVCQPRHEDIFAICRLAAGECDALEFCDGVGNCAPDGFKPPGTACGDPGDTECDNPDTCDGVGNCVPDGFAPPGTPCGDPTDTDCDRADTCDGAGACQENIEPLGTPCGDPSDTDCDSPDTCDGAGGCQQKNEPDDLPCPDDLFCNGEETCLAGACVDDTDPCSTLHQRCDEDFDICIELVPLDIKPGSCPNRVNRSSRGVVPVALVGSDTFDVNDVDLSTLVLSRADGIGGGVIPIEGPPGPHTEFDDVTAPFDGLLCECGELEGDGLDDLSMKFRTQELAEALELDDVAKFSALEVVLTGELFDGTPFEASDCIDVLGSQGRDPRR